MRLKPSCARAWAVVGLGGALYALLFSLGSQIDARGYTALGDSLLRFACAWPVAACVLAALFSTVFPRLVFTPDAPGKRPFCTLGAFALIFACYVPLFLIEYPGSFMYDTQRQVFQIARNQYDAFHPLAHTLLIRLCIGMYDVLQSFEKCAALYSVIQMTLMAGCFALACGSLARSVSRRAARIGALFFALYPAHMAFASNCTKDGLFSAFFVLFLAYVMELMRREKLRPMHAALCVLCGALACLLRNNMIYSLLVWAAALAVICLLRRRGFARMLVFSALAIALGLGANGALMRLTHAGDGSAVEMLSVPIAQLSRARLLAPDAFSEAEKRLMDEVFVDANYGRPEPLYTRYEPTLCDPVKNNLDEQVVLDRMDELAAMWASVGGKCPGIYLDAFLHQTHSALYPYARYRVAQPYIEIGMQPGGVFSGPFGAPPMTQPGRFAAIREFLYERIYKTGADDVPVVRWLFNIGGVFWLLLALYLYDLYRGDWARAAVLLLPVLLYGTYLLGPVMQGRYLYPFICALPLFALTPVQE